MDATPTMVMPPSPPAEQVIQGEPPPLMVVQQQAYTASHGHGSVGPVIGVVAAIAVLGVIAGLVGRLCGGRTVMGYGGRFDMEQWVETKCSSCVDGYVGPPPLRPPPRMVVLDMERGGTGGGVGGMGNGTAVGPNPVVGTPPVMNTGEIKTEEEEERERGSCDEEQQHQHQNQHRHHQIHEKRHSHVDES